MRASNHNIEDKKIYLKAFRSGIKFLPNPGLSWLSFEQPNPGVNPMLSGLVSCLLHHFAMRHSHFSEIFIALDMLCYHLVKLL